MLPSEVIDKALTEVIPDVSKWCQGTLRDLEGRMCLGGAFMEAAGLPVMLPVSVNDVRWPPYERAVREVWDIVRADGRWLLEGGANDWDRIGAWNDATSYDEVRAVMEKARASLQEQGQ